MALTKITGEGVGAVDNLTVDTNTLHVDAANNRVGVGTASPSEPFHIVGASGAATDMQIQGGDDTNSVRLFMGGNTNPLNGRIVYSTASDFMAFSTGGDQRVRVDSDGLKFGSDTAAANALDDYEEGTFTPVIDGEGSCTIGTSSVIGLYTKIGRLVNCQITYNINSVSGGASNLAVDVSGLPFTTNTNSNFTGSIRSQNLAAACEGVQIIYFNNATSGRIEEFNGQGGTNFSDHVASNSIFIINVTYMTA